MNQKYIELNKFRMIKKQHSELYGRMEKAYEESNKNTLQSIFDEILLLQKELLSYNLSNINAEEWENLFILPNNFINWVFDEKEPEKIDFSNTFANIDFKYFEVVSSNYNFKNCNISNIYLGIEYLDAENQDCFDSEVLSNIRNIYLNSSNVDEILELNKYFPISDYKLSDFEIRKIMKNFYNDIDKLVDLSKQINISQYLTKEDLKDISSLNIEKIMEIFTEEQKQYIIKEKLKTQLNIEQEIDYSLFNLLNKEEKEKFEKQNFQAIVKYLEKILSFDSNNPKDRLKFWWFNINFDLKKYENVLDITKIINDCIENNNIQKLEIIKESLKIDFNKFIDKNIFKILVNEKMLFYYEFKKFYNIINFDLNEYLDLNLIKDKLHELDDNEKLCLIQNLKIFCNYSLKTISQIDEQLKDLIFKYPEIYFVDENIISSDKNDWLHMDAEFSKSDICSQVIKWLENYDFQYIEKLKNYTNIVLEDELYEFLKKYIEKLYMHPTYEKLIDLGLTLDCNELLDPIVNNIIQVYNDIEKSSVKKVFRRQLSRKNNKNITIEKIEIIKQLIINIENSNSSEIQHMDASLLDHLLNFDNPLAKLSKIENIFLRNNIPYVGKIFSVFKILYPKFEGFNFDSDIMCPSLKNKSNLSREITIFSDLLKATSGSNNRNLKEYLKNIKIGNYLLLTVASGQLDLEQLDIKDKEILETYISHLNELYNNTIEGKKNDFEFSDNLKTNIYEILKVFSNDGKLDYNLPDRIVKMFGHFAGFDTYDDLMNYIENRTITTDKRNREKIKKSFKLEKGDFIKGFDVNYFSNILQNGSIAKEYLGDSAESDFTPLDTDLSIILDDSDDIDHLIKNTEANDYGDNLIVLKNDDRFCVTRKSPLENENTDVKYDKNKLEAFYTGYSGKKHYGIRTGFASSEIDYFISRKYDSKIGFEIAKNGFYIPVIDENGKLLFSPQDYDYLRSKMDGLSYYETNTYKISNKLINDDTIYIAEQLEKNNEEVAKKNEAIKKSIQSSIENRGLILKTSIGNLTEGIVEFINTGSTGRGTNVPGDGDFDFIIKLDKKIIVEDKQVENIINNIKQSFINIKDFSVVNGVYKFKGVSVEGLDETIDIDITFTNKTDKVNYSTDMCVRDRLNSIKEQYPEQYNLVISNIILAKKILKEGKVYKKDSTQGGLGGVGIENWILQNGGSFEEAANDFINYSNNSRSFEEFKKNYEIWDFGENHLAAKKGFYPHDNFVNNMNESGYNKMKIALSKYIDKIKNQNSTNDFKVR